MFFWKQSSKIKDSKIALDSRIEVHDKSQFEVKFDYNFLNTLSKSDNSKEKKYSIEAFFFIPKNVGISAINYSKSQFYTDLHAYIRFKTPDMTFNEVYDENNVHSPLRILKINLEKLLKKPSEELNLISINEAKLFGCLVNGFLKESTNQVKKLISQATYLKNASSSPKILNLIEKEIKTFINDALNIFSKYRVLRKEYEEPKCNIDQNVLTNIKLADEYITYRLENSFASIYNEIENLSNLKNIDCKNILSFITQIAYEESQYRLEQGFICFKNSTSINYEYYAYRFSAIKKHIFQVLYLDIRHVRNEKKYKNYMAMLGAGIAALVYLPAQAMLAVNANISFSVIFLVVTAYMFKDRIKELSREYLFDKLLDKFSTYFPDYDLFIQDYTQLKDKNNRSRNIIGRCKEHMHFIDKEKVNFDITTLRNLDHVVDIDEERDEEVIHYTKNVYLNSQKIITAHHRRTNIKDIIRFNIVEFLNKLDNPIGNINFFDLEKNIFTSIKAPKVYHLNIIFKYTIGNDTHPIYQRIRVVLDKNGIVRIDEVVPRCKFDQNSGNILEEKVDEKIYTGSLKPESESIFDNVNL